MTDTTTTTAPTRNGQLAEWAALAHEFLTTYAGMPDVAIAHMGRLYDPRIRLQLAGDDITTLATWALELGTTVRMTDKRTYVYCSVETAVHNERIELWNHLQPVPAYKLLAPLGIEATETGVDVDPARLLTPPTTQEGVS